MASHAIFHHDLAELGSSEVHLVPIGVALWDEDAKWARMRFLADDEFKPCFTPSDVALAKLALEHVQGWISKGVVRTDFPDRPRITDPHTDQFWRGVKDLLVHRTKLTEPRAIDVQRPLADELEALFESVVRPTKRFISEDEPANAEAERAAMEALVTVRAANVVSKESWLNGPEYAEFMAGYGYASTQTKAIPALSKCSPEEMYHAYELINLGVERKRWMERDRRPSRNRGYGA